MTSRRTLGAFLLAATYLPLHLLLDPRVTGLAGRATRDVAGAAWDAGVWGTALVVVTAALLAWVVPEGSTRPWIERSARMLEGPSRGRFALWTGVVAFVLSAVVARVLLGGLPSSVDEMVQLLHAQALLHGSTALPLPGPAAAWMVQNSIPTPAGLASVYPPMHTLALAAGLAVGASWIVGPVATGVTVGVTALVFERIFAERRTARFAGALTAVSPFIIFLGGTDLSHTTAAALAAATAWSALRARDGSAAWAFASGAIVGAFVCTRPWTGVVLATVMLVVVWGPEARRRTPRWLLARAGLLLLGGLPFAAFLFWWNAHLFGSPLRLGYLAAFGPLHGLGFHTDPWGNLYGPAQALGYTGADLVQLGTHLLESPLPALAVVGLALLLVRRLPSGTGLLIGWAFGAVGANALYWHHGIHMGPRLLYESAPAWAGLWAVSIVTLSRGASRLGPRGRQAVLWAGALSLAGGLLLVPGRASSYRVTAAERTAARLPSPPGPGPSLVFVHGSWPSRVSARLVADGMRRDSVETALRRNDLCSVSHYATWRGGGRTGPMPPLDLEARPGSPTGLERLTLSPGDVILVAPGQAFGSRCVREATSDHEGTIELDPLLWQAPPSEEASLVIARDLGPETNEMLRSRLPGRTAYVYVAGAPGEPQRLMPYAEGMRRLWGEEEPEGTP